MLNRIRKTILGLLLSASICSLQASGCATVLIDEVCSMDQTCGDQLSELSDDQEPPKIVAIDD